MGDGSSVRGMFGSAVGGAAGLLGKVQLGPLGSLPEVPFVLKALYDAGIIEPSDPSTALKVGTTLLRWGASPATGVAVGAIKHPERPMLIDELGELSYAQVHERTNALANALREEGIGEGDGIAIMCRNHRGFVEATLAAAKLGATALYMNTAFAAPQLKGVVEREQPVALVYDQEFAGLLAEAGDELKRYVAWREDGEGEPEKEAADGVPGEAEESGEQEAGGEDDPSERQVAEAESRAEDDHPLEALIESGSTDDLAPPGENPRFVILTSGTTGTPKGAQRSAPSSLGPLAALFSIIPLKAGQSTVIAAPLFHSWGFAHFTLATALESTIRLRRRFDPEATLELLASSEAAALVVVPVMMQRILDLPRDVLDGYELADLEVTAASGSALPGELATKWMDTFGENLYNLYGSTEVAWATIATPEDLRAAPGTSGRAPRGTVVKIVDPDDQELPSGETGRIFVGNEMAFEGYTGGGNKGDLEGLLSSGDVGHMDDEDRLFIDGRDNEMIVSGGENVFPREIEDLLSDHDSVKEVAVIGVSDEKFGQRLKAFVVLRDGASLDADEAKQHVKSNLSNFKVPREVEFIDELPRNATGKVLKRELD
ncbi:MAG: AMP-binding protein [Solirubrobacterales bacterium]|nr:AMP-binding protein [Solirubrobacterales bacterium]